MAVFVGLSDSSKEISGIYLGAEDYTKEVSDGYIGNGDGSVKEIYSAVAKPGQQVFTVSGTFTVPKGITSVDIFCVGGGGAGGTGQYASNVDGSYWYWTGTGGGGGYTSTAIGVSVSPGEEVPVIVGDGASESKIVYDSSNTAILNRAGSSSCKSCTAYGGYSGYWYMPKNRESNGGSGGGAGGMIWFDKYKNKVSSWCGGRAGSDGGDGNMSQNKTNTQDQIENATCKGQGTTTRAFGESSGTLYAGGGGGSTPDTWQYYSSSSSNNVGGGYNALNAGSGGGGSGAIGYNNESTGNPGTYGTGGGAGGGNMFSVSPKGGSGCVIIRWGY